MSKSLILLTAAASIGVSHALDCVDYGGDPNAPLTKDVTIKVADLKARTAKDSPYPATPIISTCAAGTTHCYNEYNKGVNVVGGCVAAGTACKTEKITSPDKTETKSSFCCTTDKCNNNPTALAAWPPATTAAPNLAPKSPSTTLSVATLAAAAVGIVAALLM